MTVYEYKVVPAPTRGEKARGLKTPADRFAYALETLMNTYGADGWEFVRADSLPSEERTGFTGRTTVYHNVLVFRRALEAGEDEVPTQAEPPLRREESAPLLSFSRLRLGPARQASAPLRPDPADEGIAPRLGPAGGDDPPRGG